MRLTAEMESMEGQANLQRRAVKLASYKANPNYCMNKPGTHKKDPGGCVPFDPEGRTAPLRWDNRFEDYCDPCRRRLGKPVRPAQDHRRRAEPVEERTSAARMTPEARANMKRSMARRLARNGYVELPGLMQAKDDAGLNFKELTAALGKGYTYSAVREWCLLTSTAPEAKLPRLAKVLGVSVARLKGDEG